MREYSVIPKGASQGTFGPRAITPPTIGAAMGAVGGFGRSDAHVFTHTRLHRNIRAVLPTSARSTYAAGATAGIASFYP
jgi:hypothetical protein